ncbi:phytanoyl-CoA dioxygenase family protein [Lophium mytilinum]|uniref:Phytanoyl-CoA dioxygenase family protein n=1 Tax=Lophium mytilinum TaxID=390894 RepID=A0A6A6QJ57_9PEZI|nr:phytanoyl-CoA dioxygenase family protein [Lophium mytilinum]
MAPSAIDPTPISVSTTKHAPIEIDSFDAATANVDSIVQSMIKNGGCYIRNIISPADAAAIEKDARPFLGFDEGWKPDFWPKETRRVNGLAGKSRVFMDKIASNPLYEQVAAAFLTTKSKAWIGKERTESTSHPQLNNTLVFSIGPGAKDQDLHRDDMIHHKQLPAITPEQYTFDRDMAIGLFVAGKKTTRENGATRFAPRSHLQATETPPPEESECVYAELDPGDGFFMLASCYHGGSANKTENEERLLYGCFMTRGWLRQEENQYLASPLEKIKEMNYTPKQLKMMGYSVSEPYLGWVNLQDPLKVVMGVETPEKDTLGF